MRTWVAASALVAVMVVAVARPADEKYPDKYEKTNVDEILSNDRAYHRYFDCLMDKGVCPPPGRDLKVYMCEALKTKCAKCTDHQKEVLKKTFRHMQKNKPEDLEKLLDHYDSDKKYRDGMIEFINAND